MRSYDQFQRKQTEVRARRRTEHLKDIVQDPSGTWSYEGGWMVCTLPQKDYRRVVGILWFQMILAAACLLVCGCVRSTGMEGCFYVLLPYASCILAACFCIRHLIAVTEGKGWMKQYLYAKHMTSFGPCTVWGFISCLLCVTGRIGEAVITGGWTVAGTDNSIRGSVVFLLMEILSGIMFLTAYFVQKKLSWKPQEKKTD